MTITDTEQKISNLHFSKRECYKAKIKYDKVICKLYVYERKVTYKIDLETCLEGLTQKGMIDGYSKDLDSVFYSSQNYDPVNGLVDMEGQDFFDDYVDDCPEVLIWAIIWSIEKRIELNKQDQEQNLSTLKQVA